LWGRPSASDVGRHGPITIKVTDNSGANSSVVFYVEVVKGSSSFLPAIYSLLLKP